MLEFNYADYTLDVVRLLKTVMDIDNKFNSIYYAVLPLPNLLGIIVDEDFIFNINFKGNINDCVKVESTILIPKEVFRIEKYC